MEGDGKKKYVWDQMEIPELGDQMASDWSSLQGISALLGTILRDLYLE